MHYQSNLSKWINFAQPFRATMKQGEFSLIAFRILTVNIIDKLKSLASADHTVFFFIRSIILTFNNPR